MAIGQWAEDYLNGGKAPAGGGGGSAIRITFDDDTGELNATFNELLQYFNDGKLVFLSGMGEDDGTTNYTWDILTRLQRVSYDSSLTYYAYFTFVSFYDGGSHLETFLLYSTDPDEKMIQD